MTVGGMCVLVGAQATEKAARLGLVLVCRLRSEEYQLTDLNKRPLDIGPSDLSPPLMLISDRCPPVLAYLINDGANMILRVSD